MAENQEVVSHPDYEDITGLNLTDIIAIKALLPLVNKYESNSIPSEQIIKRAYTYAENILKESALHRDEEDVEGNHEGLQHIVNEIHSDFLGVDDDDNVVNVVKALQLIATAISLIGGGGQGTDVSGIITALSAIGNTRIISTIPSLTGTIDFGNGGLGRNASNPIHISGDGSLNYADVNDCGQNATHILVYNTGAGNAPMKASIANIKHQAIFVFSADTAASTTGTVDVKSKLEVINPPYIESKLKYTISDNQYATINSTTGVVTINSVPAAGSVDLTVTVTYDGDVLLKKSTGTYHIILTSGGLSS